MRPHHAVLLLILGAFGSAACNDAANGNLNPTAPTPTTVVAPVVAPVGIAVSGKVYDTGNRPLAGATVEVMSGPSAGLKVTTVADGQYNIFGQFDSSTQFRATKDGHHAEVKTLTPYCERCNPHHWVYFALGSPVPPANIAGDYMFTITAAASCTMLPEHARRRTYSARIEALPNQPTPATTSFLGTASGANLVSEVSWKGMWFNVAGDYMEMVTGDLHGQPGFVEQTDANAYLAIGGLGTATLGPSGVSTITMAFEAEIVHCELKPGLAPLDANGRFECPASRAVSSAICSWRKHELVLTRR